MIINFFYVFTIIFLSFLKLKFGLIYLFRLIWSPLKTLFRILCWLKITFTFNLIFAFSYNILIPPWLRNQIHDFADFLFHSYFNIPNHFSMIDSMIFWNSFSPYYHISNWFLTLLNSFLLSSFNLKFFHLFFLSLLFSLLKY